MFGRDGNRLVLTRGDYGVVLPVRIKTTCEDCADDILGTDEIRVEITRDGEKLVQKTSLWSEVEANCGVLNVALEKAESEALDVGLYTWQVLLIRAGKVRNTLMRMVLEVMG